MDRISSATGLGFDWDSNGNLVYKSDGFDAWNYTFDSLNRLTMVEKDGWLSAVYSYDAGGRRVRSWENVTGGVTTDYVYSGLQVIDEVCGGTHERHVYAGGMHIASNTTGTVEYYHVDHLGSTRLKTNSSGGVVYESNYEPFGVSSDESGEEDYRYTGKQEDITGLYYYGARYYDPDTGRFITRDTVFGDLSDPQSQNRYVYCRNNPQKYTDPDGKRAIQFGLGGSFGFGDGVVCFVGQVGFGIVISNDNTGYWQIGLYREYGGGGLGVHPTYFSGTELSASFDVTITESATAISDIQGLSLNVGGDISIAGQGFGASFSYDPTEAYNDPDVSTTFSYAPAAIGGGGGVTVSQTDVYYWDTVQSPWPVLIDTWMFIKYSVIAPPSDDINSNNPTHPLE